MSGRILIYLGIFFLIAGLIATLLESTGFTDKLGKLPGDIVIKKGNFVIYIPIITSLLLSLILSLLFFLIRK